MSFLQPLMLLALPLISLPIIIHLINQWRYQTKPWGAMSFLLAANRMNRGFARVRQWIILAMRTLAVAGLIFAISRPLSSGFLGLTGGGKTDTTIVIMDRSPSMQQQGASGVSKLETARSQLGDALAQLGSAHWVAVDSASTELQEFESLDSMVQSSVMTPSSVTSDLPGCLQAALDYLKTNNPGPTEIWICSDLRQSDWKSDDAIWSVIREQFQQLPQSVRINLLAYPEPAGANVAVTVSDVYRSEQSSQNQTNKVLSISMRFARADGAANEETVPVQIEIDGTVSELPVSLTGSNTEIRNHQIALPNNKETGWGRVTLPADGNNADNQCFFVYAEEPPRRIVVVSENRKSTRALEIAASISPDGKENSIVDVLPPEQIDSLTLEGAALLLWQTDLPTQNTAALIDEYVASGGQVMFLPPSGLLRGIPSTATYAGVRWDQWTARQVMVENWRGDQDLLAATDSGVGLPVGSLEINGFGSLQSEVPLTRLGTLTDGLPLLAKLPSDQGGVYFFTASANPDESNLAETGVVLFVAIQRAIASGQTALGQATQRIAGNADDNNLANWNLVAGNAEALSTEFDAHAGVYTGDALTFAINRATVEDRREALDEETTSQLFEGLPFARVDATAGSLAGIVREIWRLFLILMILALLIEAALCIPRAVPNRVRTLGTQN